MFSFLAVALAIFLDRLFGELPIYHPLRGFSRFAIVIEDAWHKNESAGFNRPESEAPEPNPILDKADKIKGSLAAVFLVIPFVSIAALLSKHLIVPLNFVFDVLVMYLALGAHNLTHHALNVQKALASENIEAAKKELGLINNSDTNNMGSQNIIAACLEAIFEHGNDALIAPVFWFIIGGAPGAVLYRLINTLSTMWGFHSIHYKNFGWLVLKANDLLNWIPARLTAFFYIFLGDMKNGWQCLNNQVKPLHSPNSEVLMAAGAGSLNVEIGGDTYFRGELKTRPKLGVGKPPDLVDISRAGDLVDRSLILWLAFILLLSLGRS